MVYFKIALRNLQRRKARAFTIGILVSFGTFLLVFGGIFAQSAKAASKQAIIDHFTGDLVIYSKQSKDIPSPFSFGSLLPSVPNANDVVDFLKADESVESFTGVAQNLCNISVERDGVKYDFSFLFYAIEPQQYERTFDNVAVKTGSYFGEDQKGGGIMMSQYQAKAIKEKYGISLEPGEKITLLSLTSSGSVNAQNAKFYGTYEPKHYSNVFNYIGIMDLNTYSNLYNFTGVNSDSLPNSVNNALSVKSDDDIFGLSGAGMDSIKVEDLTSKEITGYTMINVKLKDHGQLPAFKQTLEQKGFEIKTATWNEASSFFAVIADIIQGVIYLITFIIFLIVALILTNTLIINIIERTTEIGTLRALGAERGFIRSLFIFESLTLNTFFALIGIGISLIILAIIGPGGIALPDFMSQYLVGGGNLPLSISMGPIIQSLLIVLAVSFLATLSPTRAAARVSPLQAMSGH